MSNSGDLVRRAVLQGRDMVNQLYNHSSCRKVYVVNDYLFEYPALKVKWEILNSSNEVLESGTIACSVPENCLRKVGEVSWKIPHQTSESYRIKFELSKATELLSSNEYTIKVRLN